MLVCVLLGAILFIKLYLRSLTLGVLCGNKGLDQSVCWLCVEGQGIAQGGQLSTLLQEGLLQPISTCMEILLEDKGRCSVLNLYVNSSGILKWAIITRFLTLMVSSVTSITAHCFGDSILASVEPFKENKGNVILLILYPRMC